MGFNRNDIKLSFDKDRTQFFVNEKKGIVTCVIEAYLRCPFAFDSKFVWGNFDRTFEGFGMARCQDGDEFDVEKGKRIALAKAENNAYRLANSYLCDMIKEFAFYQASILKFQDKAFRHDVHNTDYIESLHNPDHPMYKPIVTKIKQGTTNGKPNFVCENENMRGF